MCLHHQTKFQWWSFHLQPLMPHLLCLLVLLSLFFPNHVTWVLICLVLLQLVVYYQLLSANHQLTCQMCQLFCCTVLQLLSNCNLSSQWVFIWCTISSQQVLSSPVSKSSDISSPSTTPVSSTADGSESLSAPLVDSISLEKGKCILCNKQ